MSTLIQLTDIHKAYGPTPVLDGVSVQFARNDKVGFIGRNGSGKSTLCKIVLGQEEQDGGQVSLSPSLRLSYLEQHDPFRPEETVLAFLMRYTGKEDWQCGKIAGRFQLKNEILEAQISSLPGGFQTRVKLAAMLLRSPNFLILDEPTNYLDLRTLILLERFLRDFSGAFLIVSHDREFLKRTCERTLEVDRGKLIYFPGDVEAYLEYRAEQQETDRRFNENVDAKRRHLEKFIAKNRVRASTASRAQSKMKQLEKLESIEIENAASTVNIRIPQVETRKGNAFRCEDLEIGYPERTVARDIRFEIERGEHVAVLGDNGQGKTTFLRTIARELEAKGGSFQWGHALGVSYYAQHVYASLDEKLDIYTYLEQEAASGVMRQGILDMAGSFLFHGDETEKKIKYLSGGERARVCLAGMLLAKRPVLLLDEPTNHLDFATVEALGAALKAYKGTIFFISHDRTFVSMIATSIVDVKDGKVTLYSGNYGEYVYHVEQEAAASEEEAESASSGGAKPRAEAPKTAGYARRKELRSRANRLRTKGSKLEASMNAYEKERQEIQRYYLENPTDYSKEKQTRMEELSRLLGSVEEEWLGVQEEVEGIEEEIGDGR
jgi:ATP-binding cassette subfamily F protein 3